MPRVQIPQQAFNAGELSEQLAVRTDFSKFANGVETAVNVIPLPEGGLTRRAGTRYVADEADSTVKGRLAPFQFSTEQAYVLELGEQLMRFYRNQGQIAAPDITASISNGTFTGNITGWTDQSGAGSSIAHDATNDRLSLISNGTTDAHAEQQVTNALVAAHVLRFRVLGAPGDSVKLRIGTASTGTELVDDFEAFVGWHTYEFTTTAADFYVQFLHAIGKTIQIDDVSLIDNTAVEITTPWTEAQLFNVEGPQSADVRYLFHDSHPTYKLERRGHATWALVEVAWQDGPWLDENTTSTTLTFSAATGIGVTVTASSITGINDGQGFLSTDVGRLIRLTASTVNWGWAVITGHTSTTVVTVDVKRTVTVTTGQTKWRLGAWSGTTGYPSGGTFFEQRLFAFATSNQPQTFWASETGDFESLSPDSAPTSAWDGTVQDDDALDYTLSADNVNAIRWMSAGEDTLAIGTVGGEWSPSSVGAVLSPLDITVRRQTTHGSARVQPVRVGRIVLFVQRALRKIWELGFSFDVDGLQAFDMTRLASHITRGNVVEMAFAEEPNSEVWAVREDGVMASMTFRREEDIVGWARHIIGGNFGGGHAVVESIAIIPGSNAAGQTQDSTNRDEVWVSVKRTINGATKRYVEFMERDFETGDDQEDAYYADSLITYDGAATTTITGLDHLEGETVKIWGDGAVRPDKTVSGGSITLDTEASVAQIGLGYTHTIKTLKIEGGNPSGTAVGRTKRIYGVTFVVLNSHTLSYGPDTSNLTEIAFREVSDPMDNPVPLFTGERFVEFDGDWEPDSRIVIQEDDPAPFTLLALVPEIDIKGLK